MATIAITRAVAEKHCSKCKRLLPAAEFNRANWLPSGLRSDCKDCYRAFKKDWWARQPKSDYAERRKELVALAALGERRCRLCGEIRPADDDNFARVGNSWDSNCRPCSRIKTREWALNNAERAKAAAAAGCAARYAAKRQRIPPWSTKEDRAKIRSIYAECKRISRETGIQHHVDHIVPLVGKFVSGLHVPGNLQIILGSENCKKSNKWTF